MRYNFNFCCWEELLPDGTWWHPTARFFALYDGAQFAPWDTDLRRERGRMTNLEKHLVDRVMSLCDWCTEDKQLLALRIVREIAAAIAVES